MTEEQIAAFMEQNATRGDVVHYIFLTVMIGLISLLILQLVTGVIK